MNDLISNQNINFESIKIIKNDSEFWSARDLQTILGYTKWQKFEEVVNKAKVSCSKSNHDVAEHFTNAGKLINTAKTAKLKIKDYLLSRYACYLIAQNGDSRKP